MMLFYSTKKTQTRTKTNGKTFKYSSLRNWRKIHKGKTKYMTNYSDSEHILTEQKNIFKVKKIKYIYLWHATHLKDTITQDIYAWIKETWSCLEIKHPRNSFSQTAPYITHKKETTNPCVFLTLTQGCQTWSLNNQPTNKEELKEQNRD